MSIFRVVPRWVDFLVQGTLALIFAFTTVLFVWGGWERTVPNTAPVPEARPYPPDWPSGRLHLPDHASAPSAASASAKAADSTGTWVSGITALSSLGGLVVTGYFAFKREQRDAARAEDDLRKVQLENERLRAELRKHKKPTRRRLRPPS